jgi:hypothetical protein
MTPWPGDPTEMERSNRATVERLAGVPVACLRHTTREHLAEAGSSLPIGDWL